MSPVAACDPFGANRAYKEKDNTNDVVRHRSPPYHFAHEGSFRNVLDSGAYNRRLSGYDVAVAQEQMTIGRILVSAARCWRGAKLPY